MLKQLWLWNGAFFFPLESAWVTNKVCFTALIAWGVVGSLYSEASHVPHYPDFADELAKAQRGKHDLLL